MEPSARDLEERGNYMKEARESALLDAAFFINYYNEVVLFYRSQSDSLKIAPQEVFPQFDPEAFAMATEKSKNLLGKIAYVGAAFFNYSGEPPYEDALQKMKLENPGFSERCYELAVSRSIVAMR
jgi:hypothetical protein